MADSDSSGCDIGPTLPPSMRGVCRDDRTTGPPRPSRTEDPDVAIRPALPPHLTRTQVSDKTSSSSSRKDEVADSDLLGPALPRWMGKDNGRGVRGYSESGIDPNETDDAASIGPASAPHLIRTQGSDTESLAHAGPSLPPSSKRDKDIHSQRDAGSDDDHTYGPVLPPSLTSKQPDEQWAGTIGPALPPRFRKAMPEAESDDDCDDNPDVDESDDESSSEEIIGPMPPTKVDFLRQGSAAQELEDRAAAMKNKLTRKDEDVAPSRDSWMTELPEFSKNFGMGPRTFRKNARPDKQDRSGWTETPADRARKQQERIEKAAAGMRSSSSKEKKKKKKKERREEKMSERDKRLANDVVMHNQTARPESLMDMHTKSRKRKLEEGGLEKQERRAFDRETDLQVNRFDEARRKQLLKRSAHLGDKFSHSSEKMYL